MSEHDEGDKNCSGDFLDDHYSRRVIMRYERIFGPAFVSTGGRETTERFTSTLNLQPGMKVLDLGCGAGGSAFFLAKKFDGIEVLGMDLSGNMLARAEEHRAGMEPELQARVSFRRLDATKAEFPDCHFDLVYSRDAIIHIGDKDSLYRKVLKWLKPGGQLMVTEYIHLNDDPKYSKGYMDYTNKRDYKLLTLKAYTECLKNVGFMQVCGEDQTAFYSEVSKKEMDKLMENKDKFVKEFSEIEYDQVMESWEVKEEQGWGLFTAVKPST